MSGKEDLGYPEVEMSLGNDSMVVAAVTIKEIIFRKLQFYLWVPQTKYDTFPSVWDSLGYMPQRNLLSSEGPGVITPPPTSLLILQESGNLKIKSNVLEAYQEI